MVVRAAARPIGRVDQDGRARPMFFGCSVGRCGFGSLRSPVAPGLQACADAAGRVGRLASQAALLSAVAEALEETAGTALPAARRRGFRRGWIDFGRGLGDETKVGVRDGLFVWDGRFATRPPAGSRWQREQETTGDGRGYDRDSEHGEVFGFRGVSWLRGGAADFRFDVAFEAGVQRAVDSVIVRAGDERRVDVGRCSAAVPWDHGDDVGEGWAEAG